jgi:hypothetical protein
MLYFFFQPKKITLSFLVRNWMPWLDILLASCCRPCQALRKHLKKALDWAEFWQDHSHTAGQLLPALPGTQKTPQKSLRLG